MKVFISLLTLFLFPITCFCNTDSKETAAFFVEKPSQVASTVIKAPVKQSPSMEKTTTLNIKQIFSTAPFIYSILLCMSVVSVAIWLYSLITFRSSKLLPHNFTANIRMILSSHKYLEALEYCKSQNHLLSKITQVGILSRSFGPQVVFDSMKSEGKRRAANYWQRISLLNDIVTIAPMLGLLGTVIGMFYAFYDINRSVESITALFDGLGIAVGTTVCGLFVSILSMAFYTTIKHRLVKVLTIVETEALSLGSLIRADENEVKRAFKKTLAGNKQTVEDKS